MFNELFVIGQCRDYLMTVAACSLQHAKTRHEEQEQEQQQEWKHFFFPMKSAIHSS